MAVRDGSYGIFNNTTDFKMVMQNSLELQIEYRVIAELPDHATPIYSQFRWNVQQVFEFQERGKVSSFVLYKVYPIEGSGNASQLFFIYTLSITILLLSGISLIMLV